MMTHFKKNKKNSKKKKQFDSENIPVYKSNEMTTEFTVVIQLLIRKSSYFAAFRVRLLQLSKKNVKI